jgi:hypothetical protein
MQMTVVEGIALTERVVRKEGIGVTERVAREEEVEVGSCLKRPRTEKGVGSTSSEKGKSQAGERDQRRKKTSKGKKLMWC